MVSLKHIKYLRQCAINNGFSLPEGFLEKSPQWLRKHYNGIGAEWMPGYVRKLITKGLDHMEPEALVHDIEFLNQVKTFWNFTKANLRLLYNSFKAGHLFYGVPMFAACQLFGWSAFKDGKETMAYYYYYEEKQK